MGADDRKQRILNHLQQSSSGVNYSPKKMTQPTPMSPPPVITPELSPASVPVISRKRQVMSHVKLSDSDFGEFSLETPDKRKKQIQDHLKKSLE